MKDYNQHTDEKTIVKAFFSDPARTIRLKKGEILLDQDEENHRLFYVQKGKMVGYLPDKHFREPVFEAAAGSFVGVYSYCSEEHKSYSRVMAAEPTEVCYCETRLEDLDHPQAELFGRFLFYRVVLELRSRQSYAAQMAREHQEVLNKLIKTEKLITLGQLSAGLAHELNNTIGSLGANLGQLEESIGELLTQLKPETTLRYFERGLADGIRLSSAAAREARDQWPEKWHLDRNVLRKLTKAGIDPAGIRTPEEAGEAANLWSLGCMLHDMQLAASQATHIIGSIKSMGIARQVWSAAVDVNKTIREAVALLHSLARNATLELELDEEIPLIEACHGELVQVWLNLIKNALESVYQSPVEQPRVHISSKKVRDKIQVTIEDNGPGIPPEIMEKIFEPSFTTKVEGISLGLGLGLTIVQRIVDEHQAQLKVESQYGQTKFIVKLTQQKKP